MVKHSHKYQHFALDQDNNIVDIKNTVDNNKYFCPSCNTEMILKRGQIRQWHFAHKTDKCSYDKYLHSIATRMIADWFNKSKSIKLTLNVKNKCSQYKKCKIYNEDYCSIPITKSFDLKKFYHKCIIEHKYNNFIADIYCEHKTAPIFIEIYVTHECSFEKKNSGIRIIELQIKSEEDIMNIINSSDLIENPNIKLYNFKRPEDMTYDTKQYIQKYILYHSLKSYVDKNLYTCKNYDKIRKGIYEISIPYDDCIPLFIDCGFFYMVGQSMAYSAGYLKKSCTLCRWQAVNDMTDEPAICKLYKKCGNPKYCMDNESAKCSMFKENTNEINKAVSEFKQYKEDNWTDIWIEHKLLLK